MKKVAKRVSSKKYAQKVHAIDRLRERYELVITEDEYNRLCNYIKKGKLLYEDGTQLEYVGKQSNRVTVWRIKCLHSELIACYDKERKTICTVLPPTLKNEEIFNIQHAT